MPSARQDPTSLADAITLHQLALQAEGRSVHTQKQYLYYERLFLRFLDGQRIPPTLGALNLATVQQFLGWYRTLPGPRRIRKGEVAVRAAADILKRLGQVIEDHGLVEDSPLRKLKRPRIAKITRVPFSQAEITALWAATKQTRQPVRDEALFLLLLDTGMRIGEACSLRLDSVDLDQLHVKIGTEGKGRRERLVPIGVGGKRDGGRTVRALRAYLERRPESPWGGDYLFLGRDGRPLTPEGGNDVIKRLGEMAGVPNTFPHRLRHTFATWYLTVHVGDELGLRRIIGHVSDNVLADYVHLSRSTVAERAGRASLAETLAAPATRRQLPDPSPLERRFPPRSRVQQPALDPESFLESAKTDPEFRRQLLQMLIGAT